jgi:hypothetical protein
MSASFDAAAQGSPDWQGGILTENFNLLTAYGNTHLYFAVPRGARLARKADGSPQFFLEFVSDRNDSKAEDSLYAVLDLGLERNGDIAGAYNLIPTGAALMPATFTTGTYCHLECGDSHETAPFAWENAQRATVHSRISPNSGQLVYAALATGTIRSTRSRGQSCPQMGWSGPGPLGTRLPALVPAAQRRLSFTSLWRAPRLGWPRALRLYWIRVVRVQCRRCGGM